MKNLKSIIALLVIFAGFSVLSGCGQKGALVKPKAQLEQSTTPKGNNTKTNET